MAVKKNLLATHQIKCYIIIYECSVFKVVELITVKSIFTVVIAFTCLATFGENGCCALSVRE